MRKPDLEYQRRYYNILQKALLIAVAVPLFAFLTSVDRVKRPYSKDIEEQVITIDLPPEFRQITKPPPPPRPTVPVETESEDIPDDVTIETTDLNVYSAPARPQAPPAFVVYDTSPEIIHPVVPDYPELARQAGVEGIIYLNLWVNEEGEVVRADFLKGPEIFKAEARAAAVQMKFSPALQRDKPVAVWVTLPFHFSLSDV
jgi:protein TonB